MTDLLEVRGLTVELPTAGGWVRPVNDVSLRIGAGESLGLVGESGSGKTMLALAVMGLLPPGARVSGEAWLGEEAKEIKKGKEVEGKRPGGASPAPTGERGKKTGEKNRGRKNLVGLPEAEWRAVRGGEIAMV